MAFRLVPKVERGIEDYDVKQQSHASLSFCLMRMFIFASVGFCASICIYWSITLSSLCLSYWAVRLCLSVYRLSVPLYVCPGFLWPEGYLPQRGKQSETGDSIYNLGSICGFIRDIISWTNTYIRPMSFRPHISTNRKHVCGHGGLSLNAKLCCHMIYRSI